MSLTDILKETAGLTDADLDAGGADPLALARRLLRDGRLSQDQYLNALGRYFDMEVVRDLAADRLDSTLVASLPVEWARANHMLPVRHAGGVGVLLADPARLAEQSEIALLLGCHVTPLLAPEPLILKGIEQCYYQRKDSPDDAIRALEEGSAPAGLATGGGRDDLLQGSEDAPVTRYVNLLLLEALKRSASDIHLEPFEKRLRVRYRVDGVLYEQAAPPKALEAALVSRLKVMGKLDIAEKRLPQDGTARVRVGEREVDVRISTIPVAEGERVVLRMLSRDSTALPLTALGMSAAMLTDFRRLITEPHGAIWVTGPTGSGKTTTLYAALGEVDTAHLNVLTIEDPVEYQLPDIGQMAVKPKIGLTFAQGLRHILRQDPDVILIGETRDAETAEIAIRASLTGHLVFSTLHTNDALGAIIRLVDMGVEPFLLASATRAALAQRLVRRLCPHCRKPGVLTASEAALLGSYAKPLAGKTLYTAGECDQCLAGYSGRVGLYEMVRVDADLQEAIRSGAPPLRLAEIARASGKRTLVEEGLDKVAAGVTSLPELLRTLGQAEFLAAAKA